MSTSTEASNGDIRAAMVEMANLKARRASTGTELPQKLRRRPTKIGFAAEPQKTAKVPGKKKIAEVEEEEEQEELRRLPKYWTDEKAAEYAAWKELGNERNGPPGPPTDIKLMNKAGGADTNGTSAVSVSFEPPEWDGGEEVTEYVVYAEETGATSYDGSSYFVEYAKVEYGKVPAVTISRLLNGKEYTIGVSAISENGEGPAAEAGPWFSGATEPSPPEKLRVVGGHLACEVHFQPPKNTGGQKILRYHLVIHQQGEEGKELQNLESPFKVQGLKR
jgi:hypothetical protein